MAKPIFVRGVSPFHGWRPVPPSLFIQNHYAKSGNFGFSESILKEGVGIALLRSNGRKGLSPFYGRRTLRPLHPKSLRQIGEAGVLGNELRKRMRTSFLWEVRFFIGNGEGIEVLAKPMRLPPKLPITSLIPYGVKCCRILSFPKALFYSLAALRIK